MASKRVLILTDDLKYSCGISSYLFNFLSEYKTGEFDFYLLSSGGDAVDRFQKINTHVFVDDIYSEKKKNYYRFFISIVKLYSFIIRHNIKIVHAQNYYVANVARIASYFLKIKTIQTHHNFFRKTKKLRLLACEYQIVVNDDIKQYFIEQFPTFPKYKLKTIRCGIPNMSLFPKSQDIKVKVLNGGRLVPEKGTDIYLNAVKLLPERIFTKALFFLAGEGSETDRLLNRIEVEKINIDYLGVLEPLSDYLAKNDIFVFTSQWDSEGFPMTILEAGVCKNLIITSNFRGLVPHFANGKDGLVFTSNTPFELAEKIILSVENSSMRDELINNFYSNVQESFSLEKSVNKIIRFYKQIYRIS